MSSRVLLVVQPGTRKAWVWTAGSANILFRARASQASTVAIVAGARAGVPGGGRGGR